MPLSEATLRRAVARIPGARWLYRSLVETPGSWIFSTRNTSWLLDDASFSRLPFLYRQFARYCRVAPQRDQHLMGAEFVHRAVSWLTALGGLPSRFCVSVGDQKMHVSLVDPRSLVVSQELASAVEVRALKNYLAEGDTFVDVGANHGVFAVAASRIVGASGQVVAVEPNPELAVLVEQSLAANGCTGFQVHHLALADAEAELDFYIPHATLGSAGLIREFSADSSGRRIRVRVTTLDRLVTVDPRRRMLIKVDIECAEMRFLAGARAFLQQQRPVMFVEINPHAIAAAHGTLVELVAMFKSCGNGSWRDFHSGDERSLDELPSRQQNIVLMPAL
jgi:FkbM family methyltransferase